jgi:uncharacterized membrane protein YgcG
LEGAIADVTAKHILEEELIPDLKEGNYYSGLNSTVDALIKAAAGEYRAPEGYGKRGKGISIGRLFLYFYYLDHTRCIWTWWKGGGGYASRRGWLGQQFLGEDLAVVDGEEEVGQAAVAVEALVDLAEEVLVVVVLGVDGKIFRTEIYLNKTLSNKKGFSSIK